MGRATIISGGTDGLYQINYQTDRTRMQSRIDGLISKISILTSTDIPRLEADLAAKQTEYDTKLAALNTAINNEEDTRPYTKEANVALAALNRAKTALNSAKIRLGALSQQKKFLADNIPPATDQISAWCADMNENLSGEVGTIEIPGEKTAPVIIRPGGTDGSEAAYNGAEDGQIVPVLGLSPAVNFYNLAMLPGWQKYQPTYRLGTITAINANLCDVTLDTAISTIQNRNVNQNATLSDVPITYLDCHGCSFDVGDRVVVKFTGTGPGSTYTPTVIGFESNPKICQHIKELSSFEFVAKDPRGISLLVLDSSHIAVAYSGTNDKGFINVYEIDASYNVSLLTSLQHTTLDVWDNSLIKIDSGHLILAYHIPGDFGRIKTFSIDGAYNITEINDFQHTDSVMHPGSTTYPSLVQLDSTHYALNHGPNVWLEAYQIDAFYNISTVAPLDERNSIDSPGPGSLVQLSPTSVILAYVGGIDDGYIGSYTFDGSWNISNTDLLEHDNVYAESNSLIKFDANHFVLAYGGSGFDGFIKTFAIDGSFNITQLDSLEHDISEGRNNSLAKLNDNYVVLAYAGTAPSIFKGALKVFEIDASYNIVEKGQLIHDEGNVQGNSLGMLSDTHVILAYNLNNTSGRIKVFKLCPSSA